MKATAILREQSEFEGALGAIPRFVVRDLASKDNGNNWVYDDRMKAVTENNASEIIATVTKRYKLVQFEDIYRPAIEKFESFQFKLSYFFGKGTLHILPVETSADGTNSNEIGLCVKNSVDRRVALSVSFEVYTTVGKTLYCIPIPSGKFRRIHCVEALPASLEYLKVVGSVREIWKSILDALVKNKATVDDVEIISKRLYFGDKKADELKEYLEDATKKSITPSIWNLIIKSIDIINSKDYKSEWHQDERVDLVRNVIEEYAIVYGVMV